MPDELDMRDEDRLPWLETVEADHDEGAPIGRVIALVLIGIALLAAIALGIYKLAQPREQADGQLIAAQPGDYKVRPDDPGGLKVTGEGDAAIATSAGKSGDGAIDLKAVPEAPVAAPSVVAKPAPTPTPAAAGRSTVAAVPASGGKLVAAAPMAASRGPAAGASSGGTMVQLGAFPSEAAANSAWTGFSKRFSYLAALPKSVQSVATGGKTLYRLRVTAGSADQAADVCGRLRVAGESCFVAS